MVTKTDIIGWILQSLGAILWTYGYFVTGHPSVIDWHAHFPWWIADFLTNIESEIGMVLVFVGAIVNYCFPRPQE